MTDRVPVLRPLPRFVAVPSRSSDHPSLSSSDSSWESSLSSWDVWPAGVEWEGFRSLHIARCQRCAESFTSSSWTEVDGWADEHRCDAELAALLALITTRRAA